MKLPRLHIISPPGVDGRGDFREVAGRLQAVGGNEVAIHVRDPEAPGRALYEVAARLARGARRYGGWCVVNERLDVALVAGVDAVQLGRRALPVRVARRILPATVYIGASVHSAAEAESAVADGANYVLLGTIYRSSTHPGGPVAGPAPLAACRRLPAPVVAIGGIDASRVAEVMAAGAAAIAVRGAVWSAADPVSAVEELWRAIRACIPGRVDEGVRPGFD